MEDNKAYRSPLIFPAGSCHKEFVRMNLYVCKECNISFMKWRRKSFALKAFFVWKSC